MKSKRWSDYNVLCPFYKYQDAQVIYCKGVEEGCAIHLAFSTPLQRREYEVAFCKDDYKACGICNMHLQACGEGWSYEKD